MMNTVVQRLKDLNPIKLFVRELHGFRRLAHSNTLVSLASDVQEVGPVIPFQQDPVTADLSGLHHSRHRHTR